MGENCCGSSATNEQPVALLKADYVGSMETKLAEIGAKIDEMSAIAHEKKEQAAVKLEQLKKQKEEAYQKFQEVKTSSGDAWHEFKIGLDKAFEEMKSAVHELKAGSEKAAEKLKV
jgi:thymidylate synthase